MLKIKLLIVFGIFLTFFAGYFWGKKHAHTPSTETVSKKATRWYCSMDPQIIQDNPGKCPICGMALVPMPENANDSGPRELTLSPIASKIAEVRTAKVERKWVFKEIRLTGKVDYDETRLGYITAWIPGRLDRLYVDYTGVPVKKGDHLVSLYSPELLTAQEELVRALQHYKNATTETSKNMNKSTLEASREKLRLWGLTPEQIGEIEQRGTPSDHLTIYAPMGGIVVEKKALQGMYVTTGTQIYTIADLSQVWVRLDVYESDISWLRYAQDVEFITEAYPGKTFKGHITFIDPMLKEQTRTIKVRVNVSNHDEKLKPGMFVRAIVHSPLSRGGQVMDQKRVGHWICPMHHDQISETRSPCSLCGMDKVEAEKVYPTQRQSRIPPLVIPHTAPLITGKRAVVYVKLPHKKETTFEGREVILGPKASDHYLVLAGLQEGEEVVVHGNFKIDSSLQILAKASMMSPAMSSLQIQFEVSDDFLVKLGKLYQHYFQIQMALAQDQENQAREVLQSFKDVLQRFEVAELSMDLKKEWEKRASALIQTVNESLKTNDIQTLRNSFKVLSDQVIELEGSFGHEGKPYFLTYCPMAFDDQGAYWIQEENTTIWNSYFGNEMLHCGEFKTTFLPLKSGESND